MNETDLTKDTKESDLRSNPTILDKSFFSRNIDLKMNTCKRKTVSFIQEDQHLPTNISKKQQPNFKITSYDVRKNKKDNTKNENHDLSAIVNELKMVKLKT